MIPLMTREQKEKYLADQKERMIQVCALKEATREVERIDEECRDMQEQIRVQATEALLKKWSALRKGSLVKVHRKGRTPLLKGVVGITTVGLKVKEDWTDVVATIGIWVSDWWVDTDEILSVERVRKQALYILIVCDDECYLVDELDLTGTYPQIAEEAMNGVTDICKVGDREDVESTLYYISLPKEKWAGVSINYTVNLTIVE